MASATTTGGIRSDFTRRQHHITAGENRPIGWDVYDPTGTALVDDMDGWEVDLFIVPHVGPNGVEELAEAAVLHLTEATGLTLDAPQVIRQLSDADWAALGTAAREWWYELWKTNVGDRNRLAYGRLEVGS